MFYILHSLHWVFKDSKRARKINFLLIRKGTLRRKNELKTLMYKKIIFVSSDKIFI